MDGRTRVDRNTCVVHHVLNTVPVSLPRVALQITPGRHIWSQRAFNGYCRCMRSALFVLQNSQNGRQAVHPALECVLKLIVSLQDRRRTSATSPDD